MNSKLKQLKIFSTKKFPVGISFLVGLVLGWILGFFKIHTFLPHTLPKISIDFSWLSWLGQITTNSTFLSDVAAIEGILIGVSIPIALQVVSWSADRYKDQEIAKFFTNELLYRIQYILFLSNIVLVLLLRFLDIKNFLVMWIIFLWFVFNVTIFYRFIRLVERYVTDTDKLFLAKLKSYVQDILEK